jgi:crotonobetainyl-CoA:carnitine CoA-transferase CaiB-like acyl-CoA transferase
MTVKTAAPLAGIRVIEVADASAALAARRLADLGAEVIKIEPPQGDATRRYAPFAGGAPDSKKSLWFEYYQQGKLSLTLDLTRQPDRDTLRKLAAGADAFVETFAPGYLDGLGLGYQTLGTANPGLIYTSVTGFGQHGPQRDYRSNDIVAAASGGQLSVCGPPEKPLQIYGQQNYQLAGYFTAIGILLALRERGQSGRGQFLDISLQEAVAAALDHVLPRYQMLAPGVVPARRGNRHWNGSFAAVACRDGDLLVSPVFERRTLAELMLADGLKTDLNEAKWDDPVYLLDHFEAALAQIGEYTAGHRVSELVEIGQAMRLPWAPMASPQAVTESPQLAARDFFIKLADADGGTLTFPGVPVKFSSIGVTPRRAPAPGEHNSKLAEIIQAWQPRPAATVTGGPADILSGVRILDFTRVLAGPYATRLLADYGAEVIKVQTLRTADGPEANRHGYFQTWNRNKRGITLNLDHPEGRQLALKLISKCDAVVENFTPRVLENWDLTYPVLRRAKPDIILTSLSGFGNYGPWRDYAAFGATIEAFAGLTGLTAFPADAPSGAGLALADHLSGLVAVWATLAALAHRDATGEGQYIDISEYEVMCSALGPALAAVLNGGQPPAPTGNQPAYDTETLNACCRCQGEDKWCAISLHGEADWRALRKVLGADWMGDTRFATAASRRTHATEIENLLEQWTLNLTAPEVMGRLQTAGLTAGAVNNASDLLADPQLTANGFFQSVNHPEFGEVKMEGSPIRLSRTTARRYRPPPALGADNAAIYGELLGLSSKQIADYEARKVIY